MQASFSWLLHDRSLNSLFSETLYALLPRLALCTCHLCFSKFLAFPVKLARGVLLHHINSSVLHWLRSLGASYLHMSSCRGAQPVPWHVHQLRSTCAPICVAMFWFLQTRPIFAVSVAKLDVCYYLSTKWRFLLHFLTRGVYNSERIFSAPKIISYLSSFCLTDVRT